MKVITNMERLKEMLEQRGLKATFQRLKILEYLDTHIKTHPTAEMIYETLKEEIPTISITTIYNTLSAFLEHGLASAETITGTEVRYDLTTTPHHHFLCKKCGRIIDINVKCSIMDKESPVINGNKIENIHGYFKGICESCCKEKSSDKH